MSPSVDSAGDISPACLVGWGVGEGVGGHGNDSPARAPTWRTWAQQAGWRTGPTQGVSSELRSSLQGPGIPGKISRGAVRCRVYHDCHKNWAQSCPAHIPRHPVVRLGPRDSSGQWAVVRRHVSTRVPDAEGTGPPSPFLAGAALDATESAAARGRGPLASSQSCQRERHAEATTVLQGL